MTISYKESRRDLTVNLPLGRLILPYCEIKSRDHIRVRAVLECLKAGIYSINELITDGEDAVIQIRSYETEAFVTFGGCFEITIDNTTLAMIVEIISKYVAAVEYSMKSKLVENTRDNIDRIDLITCPFTVKYNAEGLMSIIYNRDIIPVNINPLIFVGLLRQNTKLFANFESTSKDRTYMMAIPRHWCEQLAVMIENAMTCSKK